MYDPDLDDYEIIQQMWTERSCPSYMLMEHELPGWITIDLDEV